MSDLHVPAVRTQFKVYALFNRLHELLLVPIIGIGSNEERKQTVVEKVLSAPVLPHWAHSKRSPGDRGNVRSHESNQLPGAGKSLTVCRVFHNALVGHRNSISREGYYNIPFNVIIISPIPFHICFHTVIPISNLSRCRVGRCPLFTQHISDIAMSKC